MCGKPSSVVGHSPSISNFDMYHSWDGPLHPHINFWLNWSWLQPRRGFSSSFHTWTFGSGVEAKMWNLSWAIARIVILRGTIPDSLDYHLLLSGIIKFTRDLSPMSQILWQIVDTARFLHLFELLPGYELCTLQSVLILLN